MKVRLKEDINIQGFSSNFNTTTSGEVIVYFQEGDCDSMFISELEVYLEKLKQWEDMGKAFSEKNLITDNYNTLFFEPLSEEDKRKGWV